MKWLRRFLAHPLTLGLDLDDPRTTDLRRQIIRRKPFLRRIYEQWYSSIARALPPGRGPVVELGSGAGFLDQYIPGLVTSEIFLCPGIRVVLDAHRMPIADAELRGIVMTDVLHHLPNPRQFFREAQRCLRPGGALVMIEPWNTMWSRWIFRRLHHEPFRPESSEWEFPPAGPLSGANGAMPWIVFQRDRGEFEKLFPKLKVRRVVPMMPFRYLVSGGVSMRSLSPKWTYGVWSGLETLLKPLRHQLSMFAQIELERVA